MRGLDRFDSEHFDVTWKPSRVAPLTPAAPELRVGERFKSQVRICKSVREAGDLGAVMPKEAVAYPVRGLPVEIEERRRAVSEHALQAKIVLDNLGGIERVELIGLSTSRLSPSFDTATGLSG